MKYKPGDKFEIKIDRVYDTEWPCIYKTTDGLSLYESVLDGLRRLDDMTAREAWEIAGQIVSMGCEKKKEIFGTAHIGHIFQRNTEREAKVKIEAWETTRFNENDEVVMKDGTKGVVVRADKASGENPYVYILWKDGSCGETHLDGLKKTGRRIDIQGVLGQIGVAE